MYHGTTELARFLQYLNEHKLTIDNTHTDSISILIEADGAVVRLANAAENKRIVITYSKKHGNTFLERFPDPSKRFQIQSCSISKNILVVNCNGPDLYNAGSAVLEYSYTWNLDIEEEFSGIVLSLIRAAIFEK